MSEKAANLNTAFVYIVSTFNIVIYIYFFKEIVTDHQ